MEASGALFVASLVGSVIWTGVYLMFAGHYFLTTLIDSSAGQDEINFGNDGILERWWKPAFSMWILAFWTLTGAIIVSPLAAWRVEAFAVGWGLFVWLIYPVSVLSALVANHWLYVIYPPIVPRLARKYGAFLYVHLMSALLLASSGGLLVAAVSHNLMWAIPASFAIPTAVFLYARHWGRFAWLALNFTPRKKKRRRRTSQQQDSNDAQAVASAAEAMQSSIPPTYAQAIQAASTSRASADIQAYPTPATNSLALAEQEDEWSLNKKPYFVTDPTVPETAPSLASYVYKSGSDADKPFNITKYYDDRIDEERRRQLEASKPMPFLPATDKKCPDFGGAFFQGVWAFMIYPSTIQVWTNLVLLTIVELFFLSIVKMCWAA